MMRLPVLWCGVSYVVLLDAAWSSGFGQYGWRLKLTLVHCNCQGWAKPTRTRAILQLTAFVLCAPTNKNDALQAVTHMHGVARVTLPSHASSTHLDVGGVLF